MHILDKFRADLVRSGYLGDMDHAILAFLTFVADLTRGPNPTLLPITFLWNEKVLPYTLQFVEQFFRPIDRKRFQWENTRRVWPVFILPHEEIYTQASNNISCEIDLSWWHSYFDQWRYLQPKLKNVYSGMIQASSGCLRVSDILSYDLFEPMVEICAIANYQNNLEKRTSVAVDYDDLLQIWDLYDRLYAVDSRVALPSQPRELVNGFSKPRIPKRGVTIDRLERITKRSRVWIKTQIEILEDGYGVRVFAQDGDPDNPFYRLCQDIPADSRAAGTFGESMRFLSRSSFHNRRLANVDSRR